jgi:hypothetical protein
MKKDPQNSYTRMNGVVLLPTYRLVTLCYAWEELPNDNSKFVVMKFFEMTQTCKAEIDQADFKNIPLSLQPTLLFRHNNLCLKLSTDERYVEHTSVLQRSLENIFCYNKNNLSKQCLRWHCSHILAICRLLLKDKIYKIKNRVFMNKQFLVLGFKNCVWKKILKNMSFSKSKVCE